ncbi:MAG TPA: hypothetical protein VFN11_13390 [Ktedonobacterales bacterium]|nr:hypothetical protein [Ktedonobacterales bacterium]
MADMSDPDANADANPDANADANPDTSLDGSSGLPHTGPGRYTITPDLFSLYDDDYFLFQLNMDTWYYSEWADPNQWATLGSAALGDGPLTAAQGVAAFVAQQVTDFRNAFADLFRPVGVRVGYYKPQISAMGRIVNDFPAPETPADVQATQAALEQSAPLYEGIAFLGIDFAMRATVRGDDGQLIEVWLPYAGEAAYSARYFEGYRSNLPQSVAVTELLTPAAQTGIVPWTVQLRCNFISLFRATNAEVLERVRTSWHAWLQTHPLEAARDNANGVDKDSGEEWDADYEEDYILTLAVPPDGAPPDNWDLSTYNTPRLRAAVARWEEKLSAPFEWAVTL